MKLLLLALLVVALIMHIVESKKMWGSRKKREEVEEVVVPPTPKTTIQEVGRGARQGASKRRPSQTSGFASQAPTSGEFEKMFSTYLSSFEELLNSEDFDSMVNPESIRAMLEQFPGAADIPELNMLRNMPEFNDASLLKQTMREGLAMAKESSAEIIALLNDPERMEELMGQLPHEVKQLVEGLRTGDFTALKDFVINLPGLDGTQRRLMLSLLDGNTDALAAEVQKVLQDGEQVEAARLQFLESPELAEAMGLPADALQDPAKWAELMSQGMDSLLADMAGGAGAGAGSAGSAARSSGRSSTSMSKQTAAMRELLRSFAQNAEEGEDEGGQESEPLPFARRRFGGRAA